MRRPLRSLVDLATAPRVSLRHISRGRYSRRGQGAAAPIITLLRGRNPGLPFIADLSHATQAGPFAQGVTISQFLPVGNDAVIWRETAGWGAGDYAADREFIVEEQLAGAAAIVYLNGGAAYPREGSRALEPLFKERMFAGVEVG